MDLLSMDDDNSVNSSPPGSTGGNRHRTASGGSGSAAGLSGEVLAEVMSCLLWCCGQVLIFVLQLSGLKIFHNSSNNPCNFDPFRLPGSKVAA